MSESRGQWSCGGCDRRWQSLSQAHCTVCHQQFATVGVADKHHTFGDNRAMTCNPPAEVRTKKGERVYRLTEDAYGPVWRTYAVDDRFNGPAAASQDESAGLTVPAEDDGQEAA